MTQALFYHPPIEQNPLLTAPLAYLHLAAPLKGSNHEIALVDGRILKNPIDVLLENLTHKEILLVSVMPGSQIATALEACQEVRRHYPQLPIIWGGSHPSLDPGGTLRSPMVSGVVIGRGEFIIESILDAINNPESLKKIPNLRFKTKNQGIIHGPGRSFMNRPPGAVDFTRLDSIEPYLCQTRRSRRMLDYISSFGCPNRCSFCCEPVITGSRWSSMDAQLMVSEITYLKEKFNIDGILFQDANFVTDRKRLLDFCDLLIQKKPGINWISTACLADIFEFHHSGYLERMKASGCEMLFLGAEAASEETIKKYKKRLKAEDTCRIARLLWEEYDIFPHFSYVISYPIEDTDAVRRTLSLHLNICEIVKSPTGELGFYNPTMGTPFLKENKDHFIIPGELEGWAKFNFLNQNLYRQPSAELTNLLFRHHFKLRRMFPKVESYKTFDIWQEQYIKT